MENNVITHLFFSGGGIRGLAHLGIADELQNKTIIDFSQISHLTGTSIGALMAILLSLYTPRELIVVFLNMSLNKILDLSIFNLDQWGLDSGKITRLFVQTLIFGKTKLFDPTFSELFASNGKTVQIVTTNLSKKIEVCFSHTKTPHIKVCDAVLASMSLPFLFKPVTIQGDLYTDGSVINNYPFQSRYRENAPIEKCLFMEIKCEVENGIKTIDQYISQIITAGISAQIKSTDCFKQKITAYVPYSTVNFHLTNDTKNKIIICGRKATLDFILKSKKKKYNKACNVNMIYFIPLLKKISGKTKFEYKLSDKDSERHSALKKIINLETKTKMQEKSQKKNRKDVLRNKALSKLRHLNVLKIYRKNKTDKKNLLYKNRLENDMQFVRYNYLYTLNQKRISDNMWKIHNRLIRKKNRNVYLASKKPTESLSSYKDGWNIKEMKFLSDKPNPKPFSDKKGYIFFNLNKDSLLVAPLRPKKNEEVKNFSCIYNFAKNSSRYEWDKFFFAVNKAIKKYYKQFKQYPYVYTHGTGVSWLHVRLEHDPKYM